MAEGAASLQSASWLPLKAPLVVVRVHDPHRERLITYMEQKHKAKLVYSEQNQHNNAVFSFFDVSPQDEADVIRALAKDLLVARVFAAAPCVVRQSSVGVSELEEAFRAAVQQALQQQTKIKLLASESISKQLLRSTTEQGLDEGLVLHGHDEVFWAITLYDSVYLWGMAPSALAEQVKLAENADEVVCKAQYKLQEAVECAGWGLGPSWRAIDVGAAPGGWTTWLAERLPEGHVFAVDPAELDKTVTARPNVTHVQAKANDQVVAAALGSQLAQLCVCDMNIDPREAAKVVCGVSAAGLLVKNAHVIVTLKMVLKGKESRKMLEKEALAILEEQFCDCRLVWLFSNTRHEATVIGTKR